jgi:hypothetical protein
MITMDRMPWHMTAVAGVGAMGLITGCGTLASAFRPMFGPWAWGVAVLLDLLALSLTVWAIQAVRTGMPFGAPRVAAHGCVVASVAAQAVTAFQGLSGEIGGWTSAILHTIPPLVLCLALELIAHHYVVLYRSKTAPLRAHEILRVQIARAATGLPVDLRACATAVVAAARADVLDVRQMARLIPSGDVEDAPAMKALCAAFDRIERANAERSLKVNHCPDQDVRVEQDPNIEQAPGERSTDRAERRRAVWALRDSDMSMRAIAEQLGVSTSTVSADLRARPPIGFRPNAD